MTKTATLYARIEPNLKTEAEGILGNLGIPVSNAINIFYRQIVIHRGLPFEVKLAPSPLINCATLTDAELDAEIQRGLDDVTAGRTRPFHDVADELKAEFGL